MAAESTRRFTKNLLKPGSAAEIRQTACNAVRHSAVALFFFSTASMFSPCVCENREAYSSQNEVDPVSLLLLCECQGLSRSLL
ncbi:hypothetical protein PAMA_020448 [Pampus argenteus]